MIVARICSSRPDLVSASSHQAGHADFPVFSNFPSSVNKTPTKPSSPSSSSSPSASSCCWWSEKCKHRRLHSRRGSRRAAPTAMSILSFLLLAFPFFTVICDGKGASIALPDRAREGEDVTLYCKHDRSGARLHQVRWLLNGDEFYRYVRVGRPQQIDYSLPGTKVDLLASDGEKVRLLKLTVLSSGFYRCEVTTEDSYQPLIGEGVMTVESGSGSSSGRSRVLASSKRPTGKSGLSLLPTMFQLTEKLVTLGALFYYIYSMIVLFQRR